MTAAPLETTAPVQSLLEALLIGVLIGAQRESLTETRHPGLRDFILIALAGGICGLLDKPWLTAATLLGISLMLALFHWELRAERTGITTELAGVTTFCMAYLVAAPAFPLAAPLGIGSAIAVVLFLEFKTLLQHFFKEIITEREFNDTLVFLIVVAVVYPILPDGRFGPYDFFSPRQVWFFIILISSISYAGYFLQKFLGEERGLGLAAILGGVASTLATTVDLARRSKATPEHSATYARLAVIANSVQFPRTLLIVSAVNAAMMRRCAIPMGVALATGAAIAYAMGRFTQDVTDSGQPSGNPFRLRPAMTFGVLFALIVFLNKFASAEFGWQALYATSALGGLVDVGTVVLSAGDLLKAARITEQAAVAYVFVALGANILLKAAIAITTGTRMFALRFCGALAAMFGAACTAWILLS